MYLYYHYRRRETGLTSGEPFAATVLYHLLMSITAENVNCETLVIGPPLPRAPCDSRGFALCTVLAMYLYARAELIANNIVCPTRCMYCHFATLVR